MVESLHQGLDQLPNAAPALIVHGRAQEEAPVLPCCPGVLERGLADLESFDLIAVIPLLTFHDRRQPPVRAEDREKLIQHGFKGDFPAGSVGEYLQRHSVALPGSDDHKTE
ncbi:hypothetical protein ACFRR7_16750 [Streptomyces sp. NPDC056909]|uniref:hypothetical protein n=1 Tax=Streptomyces sp. NPDC056909 TaxID=3345963 RepID=UPI0036D06E27